jgi:hypothetical protein
MERQMIPATLSRGETVGGVTMASGAHRNCARAGDHASTQSDPPRHGCGLRLIEDEGFGPNPYMNLTAKGNLGKDRCRVSASVRIDGLLTVT